MREEDGRRRRKADTELKTKTPHVNVGKKHCVKLGIDMELWSSSIYFAKVGAKSPIFLGFFMGLYL